MKSLGVDVPGFDGSPEAISQLMPQTRERLGNETVKFILANPEEFRPEQVDVARTIARSQNLEDVGDYNANSLLDQATEFAQAYGEVASDVAVGVSRTAGDSLKAIGINPAVALGVAASLVGLYLALPTLIQTFRSGRVIPKAR